MRKIDGGAEKVSSALRGLNGPFSIYVHLPFCLRKCPYCSFFSVPSSITEREAYLAALKKEILFYSVNLDSGATAVTVYFGGGTPTVLTPDQWDDLLSFLFCHIRVSPKAEVTVEANPESFTQGHSDLWKDKGVTRVSIGVQSFSDSDLALLERPHSSADSRRAVETARRGGFSVSADLMFGLPNQTLRSWATSVKKALSLGVDHLSLYQLTIEEDSRWDDSPPSGLQDGYPFYRWSQWYLPQKGFGQYEIASFSRPTRHSRHNLAYWRRAPVIALGAGAWGFLDGLRYGNSRGLREYGKAVEGQGCAAEETERLVGAEGAREGAILLLRTKWGICKDDFINQYGKEIFESIRTTLLEGAPSQCIDDGPEYLSLTPKGMRVANSLWSMISS